MNNLIFGLGVPPTFTLPEINFKFITAIQSLSDKGNLVYEYNPFRNYRMLYDLYRSDALGRLCKTDSDYLDYIPIVFSINVEYNGEIFPIKTFNLTINNIYDYIKNNEFYNTYLRGLENLKIEIKDDYLITLNKYDLRYKNSDEITLILNQQTVYNLGLEVITRAGALLDLDTNLLNFSFKNPVLIECLESYDGSLNLILNDDYSPPKLINSRFIPLELNTFKVANRSGENDTNIYDQDSFDIDASLYKRITTIPKLTFNGLLYGGNMKCGNYTFYFKYSDADGNETDFVAESGQVVCHVGNLDDPKSIRGGIRNENSNKMVSFYLRNIDKSYDFVTVYYTRSYSDIDGVKVVEAAKLDKEFKVDFELMSEIIITGFEPIIDLTIADINVGYNIVDAVKALTQHLNMLFMGNVHKPEIPYEDLLDLSLRIYPFPFIGESIGSINHEYSDPTNLYEYYNVKNIYNKLSYWDGEIYRFGVVYILNDYSLSPVFNIRGGNNIKQRSSSYDVNNAYFHLPVYNYNSATGEYDRKYFDILEDFEISGNNNFFDNAKGVVRFNIDTDSNEYVINSNSSVRPIGVEFLIPEDVITELKKLCKGYFIVRQNRIPTILCQALTIGLDKNAYVPLIPVTGDEDNFITERFIDDNLILNSNFSEHIFKQKIDNVEIKAALAPEVELRMPLFQQLFTGSNFTIRESKFLPLLDSFLSGSIGAGGGDFYIGEYKIEKISDTYDTAKITLVPDDLSIISSGTQFYSARAGNESEAWRHSWLLKNSIWKKTYDNKTVLEKAINKITDVFRKNNDTIPSKPSNIIRGSYGTYLGIEGFRQPMRFINIYIPGYDLLNMNNYFKIRYNDTSSFYPIMHRTEFELSDESILESKYNGTRFYIYKKYGGDAYVCNFTHRMQRNFNDPEVNINDEIIDQNTFKDNFDPEDDDSNQKINRADVNAVKIGHWVTFKCLSNFNLNMRDINSSYVQETGLTGVPRGFYPLYGKSVSGNYKIPESQIINGGISISHGEKYNYELPDVPYIKLEFDNRIMYSDIHITDAFKNGYRSFLLMNYRDYTREYGSITKLINWLQGIIIVFENGVGFIPVNERVQSGDGPGGTVYVNTSIVLPENPRILSTNFGSQWIESIIATENYVYGVDTVGKKIWRTNGLNFDIISDFKIQSFLNDFITLDEKERTPIIGLRNVKSHYNAFKKDVMFTFYDDTYGLEENVWNICYNELMDKWITFYSWVPSDSENIDNIFFSFDRTTSKWISKLGKSNSESTYSEGICLDNVVFDVKNPIFPNNGNPSGIMKNASGTKYTNAELSKVIGKLVLKQRNIPEVEGKTKVVTTYELLEDPFGSFEGFTLLPYYEYIQVGWKTDGDPNTELRETGAYLAYTKNPNTIVMPEYDGYIYSETRDNDGNLVDSDEWRKRVYLLNIKANITPILYNNNDRNIKLFTQGFKTYTELNGGFFTNSVAVTPLKNINNWQYVMVSNGTTTKTILGDACDMFLENNTGWYLTNTVPSKWYPGLTTDFWKHGLAGLMNIADEIKPTKWYGKVHPFEFEFVVADNPGMLKIFNNLYIISNKAEPESFHFEIVGEGYDFKNDKLNMFYRQELTKEFFLKEMAKDIKFNHAFKKIKSLIKLAKSYFLPLYYDRVSSFDEIYDTYQRMTSSGKDYQNLTGSEIVWDERLNEYCLVTHLKGLDIKKVGRLRGNMHYKEDIWNVEIRPINYVQKNEVFLENMINWIKKIPLVISRVPNVFNNPDNPDSIVNIPNTYKDENDNIHTVVKLNEDGWTNRKETRTRDKYLKIKVRYSGDELSVIHALKTIYTESYA